MTTIGTSVASAGGSHHVQACNDEEAGARILIYLQDALIMVLLPAWCVQLILM